MADESDFEWREQAVPSLNEGELLVRNIYLSMDPANRGWMNETESYIPPVEIGEVMRGIALGVVEESKNPDFRFGDIVQGMLGWQHYTISTGEALSVLPKDAPGALTDYLGPLGHIGLTAYFGLMDIGKPKVGETLAVSAAAGATGSLVGQIGKIVGCRVVGIAGSDEKCRWITEELGFDAAVNYRSGSVLQALQQECPDGIDVYFDNVGGKILDAALALINLKARVVICGLISMYNATRPVPGPYNFANILVRRARLEGFVVLDYLERRMEAVEAVGRWLVEGRLRFRYDIVDGLQKAPRTLNRLFDGSHQGKLIIKISEEP